VAALAAGCALVAAAPAAASSIAYEKDDNIWLTSPDGSVKHQVTTDGTADNRYQAPGQLDDGTIVAARPSVRLFEALRPDGTRRNAPLLAPGNSCGTGPLDLAVTPDSGLIVFQYVHSDFCFGGGGPRSRVTFAFSDVPTGSATFVKHDNWTAPRWVPGSNYAAMVSIGGDQIGIQGGGTVAPWIGPDPGEEIEGFDISRSGNRVLIEATPDGSTDGGSSQLELWQNQGVPSSSNGDGTTVCQLDGFATGNADPRWSPDGSQIAWEGAAGIYVSPAPVNDAGVCRLQPQLIVPGGQDPAWGAADVPQPLGPGGQGQGQTPGGDQGQGQGQTPDGADRTAPVLKVASSAAPRLPKALAKGYPTKVQLSEPAGLSGTLTLDRRSARRLGLPVTVASGSTSAAAGDAKLVLRFSRKARRKLRRARSVKLSLSVTARDAAGNVSPAASRKVTLKR
jgi:hypothetical protein